MREGWREVRYQGGVSERGREGVRESSRKRREEGGREERGGEGGREGEREEGEGRGGREGGREERGGEGGREGGEGGRKNMTDGWSLGDIFHGRGSSTKMKFYFTLYTCPKSLNPQKFSS